MSSQSMLGELDELLSCSHPTADGVSGAYCMQCGSWWEGGAWRRPTRLERVAETYRQPMPVAGAVAVPPQPLDFVRRRFAYCLRAMGFAPEDIDAEAIVEQLFTATDEQLRFIGAVVADKLGLKPGEVSKEPS